MSKIRKPAELQVQKTIKALIYGQPGLGKSTLALSAPSPLHLDFDRGVHRVNPAHHKDTLQVDSWEDVLEVLSDDISSYKTIIIDTAGKMLDFMTAYLIKNDPKLGKPDGSLTLQGYGARKGAFVAFLRQVDQLGKHLIFVAHDKEEKDGEQKIVRPEIGGSSSGDLIKELDLVGYMEAKGKARTISFDPCEKYYGKNTCNLQSVIKLSVLIDDKGSPVQDKPNDLLTQIIADYQVYLEKRKVITKQYNELMTAVKENLDLVTDASTANEFVQWVTKMDHIWDSKVQAGQLFKAKQKSLGLILNPKNQQYEKSTAAA
ncbi:AAA domain-containing protein [Arcticibacter pallidicorallinus]|uniref:AAA domain-containing protein n=1 Tax=Arcticibacter pallidicorallinus TaxID=1259464 RepID=A0A2T0U0P7_9SPHI|nr:ATP-binding protein [Arcticibacter pallidicorallinus]PRY51497.1 AAA domain-containing protein [Arcticibacter pallidicorallinus]